MKKQETLATTIGKMALFFLAVGIAFYAGFEMAGDRAERLQIVPIGVEMKVDKHLVLFEDDWGKLEDFTWAYNADFSLGPIEMDAFKIYVPLVKDAFIALPTPDLTFMPPGLKYFELAFDGFRFNAVKGHLWTGTEWCDFEVPK